MDRESVNALKGGWTVNQAQKDGPRKLLYQEAVEVPMTTVISVLFMAVD